MQMAATKMQTFSLPQIGAALPIVIAVAGQRPTRVIVRNTSAVAMLIAFDQNDLKDSNSSSVFRIPNRAADVLLLAPGQTLFAAGDGVGAQVSVAISEAFPTEIRS